MLRAVVEASVRNREVVVALAFFLLAYGGYAATRA
jgi:Cu/Ag efflux pump CusA